jgi:hypothetical protein
MAASAPDSRENAEWGFEPGNTGVIQYKTIEKGFLQGDIGITVPREYAFKQLDQDIVDIDAVCIKKDFMVDFAMGEVLLGNLQTAWDNDDASLGVLTVDADMGTSGVLVVNTVPPNTVGDDDTRVVNLPTALPISEGAYSVPNARNGLQQVGTQIKALGDAEALLATVTDTYTP